MKRTALALLAFFTALSQPAFAAKNSDSIQIKGSDTMVNLVQAWAEEFMMKQPESFIAVTGGGSGTGFAALINGSCDIAMASRRIKPAETASAEKKGIKPVEFKVGLDGLAVVVNKANPVSSLTIDQLADIFTGRIVNWKDVGGEDLKIVLLSREVNSGTHVYFKEHILQRNGKKEEFSSDALLMPSSQAIADEASGNTGAIGYFGMGYVNPNLKALSVAADAASEPVYPTIDTVIGGTYPISRPLFLYTKGEPAGGVKAFMDFALSPEGQAIVEKTDFVPLKKKA